MTVIIFKIFEIKILLNMTVHHKLPFFSCETVSTANKGITLLFILVGILIKAKFYFLPNLFTTILKCEGEIVTIETCNYCICI